MMPYLAPEAAMPMSSTAPRLAAMNARLVIQTGTDRPDVRKSPLEEIRLRSLQPMPKTKAKRSEERRGGKEGRSRWPPDHLKKKKATAVAGAQASRRQLGTASCTERV